MSSRLEELLEKHVLWLISRRRTRLLEETSDRIDKFVEKYDDREKLDSLTEEYFSSVEEPSLIGWERYVEMRGAR